MSTTISLISGKSKCNFAILQDDGQLKHCFHITDESWLCAKAFHHKVPRRFAEEELYEEYSIKRIKLKAGKKLLVWTAISFDILRWAGAAVFHRGKGEHRPL